MFREAKVHLLEMFLKWQMLFGFWLISSCGLPRHLQLFTSLGRMDSVL